MTDRDQKFFFAKFWIVCGSVLIGLELNSLVWGGIAILIGVGLVKALDAATTPK